MRTEKNCSRLIGKPLGGMKLFGLFFLLTATSALGQFQEKYFFDEELKDGGTVTASVRVGNDIVLAGRMMTKTGLQATVVKLDSTGKVLWSTSFDGPTINQLLPGSDEALYVLSDPTWITKLNLSTGDKVWESFIPVTRLFSLVEVGNDKLAVGCRSFFSSPDDGQLAFIDKASGSFTTLTVGKSQYSTIASDSDGNIYYTKDDSVFSISGTEPYNLRWKHRYSSPAIRDYQRLFVADNGKLFLFGSLDLSRRGVLVVADIASGTYISSDVVTAQSAAWNNLTETTDHVLVCWKNLGTGQYTAWWVTKINKTTGAVVWKTSNNLKGGEFGTTLETDVEVANGIAVDNNGDVHVTGSFDGPGVDPGRWGIVKYDGKTGEVMYHQVFTGDSTNAVHEKSGGLYAYWIAGKIRLIGMLQTYLDESGSGRSLPLFATMNNNGEILSQSVILGEFEFPTTILSMESYEGDIIVLKQLGRFLQLGRYDSLANLKWEINLKEEYFLKDARMMVGPSGSIAIAALPIEASAFPPYYSIDPASHILTYLYDSEGNEIWRQVFGTNAEYSSHSLDLISVYTDDTSVFVLYALEGKVIARKVQASEVSENIPLNATYVNAPEILQPQVFDDDGTALKIAVPFTQGTGIITLDKTTLTPAVTPLIHPIDLIHTVTKLADDEVIIAGKGGNDFQCYAIRYNLQSGVTTWVRLLDGLDWTAKVQVSPDSSGVIVMGVDKDEFITIRKVDFNSGAIVATFLNSTVGRHATPLDLAINPSSDEIVFGGSYVFKENGDQNIIVGLLRYSDLALKELVLFNDPPGASGAATNIEVAGDGAMWIGGSRHYQSHKAAFLFIDGLSPVPPVQRGPLLLHASPGPPDKPIAKPDAKLVLTFNENVMLGNTGIVRIFETSSSEPFEIELTSSNTAIEGSVVTITPGYLLPHDVSFYIQVDSGAIVDEAGNAFEGVRDKSWAFSIDGKPPVTYRQDPGSLAIPISPLRLFFTEPVEIGTGRAKIYREATLISDFAISHANTVIDGTVATITIPLLLPAGSFISVSIDAGAFVDRAGNQSPQTTWDFNTNASDATPPAMINLIPNINSYVNPNQGLEISFNEPITIHNRALRVYKDSANVLVTTINISTENTELLGGNTAYITLPDPLPPGAKLYIKADEGMIKDAHGNSWPGIQDEHWTFFTDYLPDPVLKLTPAPGSGDVSPYVSPMLEFYESMRANDGRGSISIHRYDTDELIMKFRLTDDNLVFFGKTNFIALPEGLPESAHVYVRVDNGAFRTISMFGPYSGNYAGIQDKRWHFTTKRISPPDETAPTLESTYPANNSLQTESVASLSLSFNEPVAFKAGTVSVFENSTDESLTHLTLTSSNTSISESNMDIALPEALPDGKEVYVVVSPGIIADLAGNEFSGISAKQWKFSTPALITGAEPHLSADELHITKKGNYIWIKLDRSRVEIKTITDVLGRTIDFSDTADGVEFFTHTEIFIVRGIKNSQQFSMKIGVVSR